MGTWKQEFPEIFREGLGCMRGISGKLYVEKDVKPIFFKAKNVPYAMKDKVETEIERLRHEGVIVEVTHSEWATPIVPILKRDGTIRICGDYKITINKVSRLDCYPIPRIDDLYANLAGGVEFSTLDLSNAYLQMPLTEESKKYTTINTHIGLFQYNRLCFGIASAPAMFQRVMDNLIKGIPNVCGYLDDILVTGVNEVEHDRNLRKVLERLEKAGIRLNENKCQLKKNEVQYLGYIINKEGLRPIESKVEAIRDAPRPTNTTQLRAYLGMLNYYGKFLKNMSNLLGPIHILLKKNKRWHWSDECEKSFIESKKRLMSAYLLVHFDASKEIIITCDASQYGIGAVMSHIMEDATERPIAFISRTLAPAEKNYSQIEKEALGVIFAVKKFHKYLFGRKFIIANDHRPLLTLFNSNKDIPQMVSGRIQRWALTLSAYDYTFKYLPGTKIPHADALSRLPSHRATEEVQPLPEIIFTIETIEDKLIDCKLLEKAVIEDTMLKQVKRYIRDGWPEENTLRNEGIGYYRRRTELHELILWGSRVIIPRSWQRKVLKLLHEGHPGMTRMKGLARSYFWWPLMDMDIESIVRECPGCQNSRNLTECKYSSWPDPQQPWKRIHMDFAGPFLGHMYLIVVDAYTKWLDVIVMGHVTSCKIIEKLQEIFATHGLPQIIVTDNGTNFASSEMSQYMKNNGIRHLFSPPYHPASNGIAERAVQTFKKAMGRTEGEGSIHEKIQRFLLNYRITPHTLTGKAPCELLMGRRIRSKLDFLLPMDKEGEYKQEKRNLYNPGDAVFAKDFRYNQNWLEGRIEEIHNSIAWVRLPDGRSIRRHINHLRTRGSQSILRKPPEIEEDVRSEPGIRQEPIITPGNAIESEIPLSNSFHSEVSREQTESQNVEDSPTIDVPPVRRSSRETRRPKRFDE